MLDVKSHDILECRVKKFDESDNYILIGAERAVAEILFHNYAPDLTNENESKVRKQLKEGYIINTDTHYYTIVNPCSDFINNIDDIDLDMKESGES